MAKLNFKAKDMTSFAEKLNSPAVAPVREKYYPSITVDASDISIGDNEKIDSPATLHAHCVVKRLEKSRDGTKVTLEIRKGDVKSGLNPKNKTVKEAMKHSNKLGAGAKKRKHLSGKDKMHTVMAEFKRGTLHSGSGQIVKKRSQAVAIALSESKKNNIRNRIKAGK